MNVPTWVWWLAGVAAVTSMLIVWSALALGSACDDLQDRIRDDERRRAALGRAAGYDPDTV